MQPLTTRWRLRFDEGFKRSYSQQDHHQTLGLQRWVMSSTDPIADVDSGDVINESPWIVAFETFLDFCVVVVHIQHVVQEIFC